VGRDFDSKYFEEESKKSPIDEKMETKFGLKPDDERMPPDLKVEFSVVAGPDKGATFVAEELPIFIGREKDAAVPLADNKISRKHATIVYKNHRFFLIDLGSRNGTCVNGKKVEGAALRTGDLLQMGDSVLSFEVKPK